MDGSHNGELPAPETENAPESSAGAMQNEGSSETVTKPEDTESKPMEIVEPQDPAPEKDSESKDLKMTDLSSDDEGKKDSSKKKSKKHKKHKSKKKKKKKKKEKNEKRSKSTSSVEDQENASSEIKSAWKPVVSPPREQDRINILSSQTVENVDALPSLGVQENVDSVKEQPTGPQLDIDSGFFGPKCPNEMQFSVSSNNLPIREVEMAEPSKGLDINCQENNENVKCTAKQNEKLHTNCETSEALQKEISLPNPDLVHSEGKTVELGENRLNSEGNKDVLKQSENISSFPLPPQTESISASLSKSIAKSRSRSKSLAREIRSRSKSSTKVPKKQTSSKSLTRQRSRSSSVVRRHRSRSSSTGQRRRSRSKSPIRRRRSRSSTPVRYSKSPIRSWWSKSIRNRQRFVSIERRRRSRTRSLGRRRRSRSRSSEKRRNSRTRSSAKGIRSRSRSANRRKSRSTSRKHKLRSRSPSKRKSKSVIRTPSKSSSPSKKRKSKSASPLRRRRSRSRSPVQKRRSRSGATSRKHKSRSGSFTRRRRSRSVVISRRQRSRSTSRRRRSRSPSTSRRRRSRSPSTSRRRRSRSPSVSRRRRSRSPSVSRRRRSRSPSVSRRRRSRSPSVSRRRRSRSPSVSRRRRSRSPSVSRRRRSRSPSVSRRRRSRSPSVSRRRRSRSPSVSRRRRSRSPSVSRRRRSRSPSVSRRCRTRSPSVSRRRRSRSPSVSRRRRSRSTSVFRRRRSRSTSRRRRSRSASIRRRSRSASRRRRSRTGSNTRRPRSMSGSGAQRQKSPSHSASKRKSRSASVSREDKSTLLSTAGKVQSGSVILNSKSVESEPTLQSKTAAEQVTPGSMSINERLLLISESSLESLGPNKSTVKNHGDMKFPDVTKVTASKDSSYQSKTSSPVVILMPYKDNSIDMELCPVEQSISSNTAFNEDISIECDMDIEPTSLTPTHIDCIEQSSEIVILAENSKTYEVERARDHAKVVDLRTFEQPEQDTLGIGTEDGTVCKSFGLSLLASSCTVESPEYKKSELCEEISMVVPLTDSLCHTKPNVEGKPEFAYKGSESASKTITSPNIKLSTTDPLPNCIEILQDSESIKCIQNASTEAPVIKYLSQKHTVSDHPIPIDKQDDIPELHAENQMDSSKSSSSDHITDEAKSHFSPVTCNIELDLSYKKQESIKNNSLISDKSQNVPILASPSSSITPNILKRIGEDSSSSMLNDDFSHQKSTSNLEPSTLDENVIKQSCLKERLEMQPIDHESNSKKKSKSEEEVLEASQSKADSQRMELEQIESSLTSEHSLSNCPKQNSRNDMCTPNETENGSAPSCVRDKDLVLNDYNLKEKGDEKLSLPIKKTVEVKQTLSTVSISDDLGSAFQVEESKNLPVSSPFGMKLVKSSQLLEDELNVHSLLKGEKVSTAEEEKSASEIVLRDTSLLPSVDYHEIAKSKEPATNSVMPLTDSTKQKLEDQRQEVISNTESDCKDVHQPPLSSMNDGCTKLEADKILHGVAAQFKSSNSSQNIDEVICHLEETSSKSREQSSFVLRDEKWANSHQFNNEEAKLGTQKSFSITKTDQRHFSGDLMQQTDSVFSKHTDRECSTKNADDVVNLNAAIDDHNSHENSVKEGSFQSSTEDKQAELETLDQSSKAEPAYSGFRNIKSLEDSKLSPKTFLHETGKLSVSSVPVQFKFSKTFKTLGVSQLCSTSEDSSDVEISKANTSSGILRSATASTSDTSRSSSKASLELSSTQHTANIGVKSKSGSTESSRDKSTEPSRSDNQSRHLSEKDLSQADNLQPADDSGSSTKHTFPHIKQRQYRSRSVAKASRTPSEDRGHASRSRSKSISRRQRSGSKSSSRKKRSQSTSRKKSSHSKSDRKKRSRSRSRGRKRRSQSKTKGKKKRSTSKLSGKRKRSRSKSSERTERSKSLAKQRSSRSKSKTRKKKLSKSPERKGRSRSRSESKRNVHSKTSSTKRSRSKTPNRRRKSHSKSLSSRSRSRSMSAPWKHSKSSLRKKRSHSSSRSVTPRRLSRSRNRRRSFSRSPALRSSSRSRSRWQRSRSRGRWRRSRSLSTSRRRSRSTSRLSSSLSTKKRKSLSPLRRRRSRSQNKQKEKSPVSKRKSISPPPLLQKKSALLKPAGFKHSIGLKSLIQKQLSQAKSQGSTGKLPKEQIPLPNIPRRAPLPLFSSRGQASMSNMSAVGHISLPNLAEVPLPSMSAGSRLHMPIVPPAEPLSVSSLAAETQLSVPDLTTANQWHMHDMSAGPWSVPDIAAGTQWSMGDLGAGAQWPMSDLTAGSHWPMHDMTVGAQWSMPDLAAGTQWGVPDVATGAQWAVPDLTAGAQWAVPDLTAGSQWAMTNMSAGAQWAVPDLAATAQWTVPDLTAGAHIQRADLAPEAQVPGSDLAPEAQVPGSDLAAEAQVPGSDLAAEAQVPGFDMVAEAQVPPEHDFISEEHNMMPDVAAEALVPVASSTIVPDVAAGIPLPDVTAAAQMPVPDVAATVHMPDVATEAQKQMSDFVSTQAYLSLSPEQSVEDLHFRKPVASSEHQTESNACNAFEQQPSLESSINTSQNLKIEETLSSEQQLPLNDKISLGDKDDLHLNQEPVTDLLINLPQVEPAMDAECNQSSEMCRASDVPFASCESSDYTAHSISVESIATKEKGSDDFLQCEANENYSNIFVEPQSSPIQTISVEPQSSPIQTISVESQSGPDQTQPVETQSSPNQASSVEPYEEGEANENYSNTFVEPQSSPIQTISVESQSGPDQTQPVETQSSPNQASSVEAQENYSNIFVEPQSSPIQTISVESQSGPNQASSVEPYEEGEANENYSNTFVEPQSSPIQTISVESQSGPDQTISVECQSGPDQTQPVETQSSPNQASSVEPYEEGEANENYSNTFVEPQSSPIQTISVESQSGPDQTIFVESQSGPDQTKPVETQSSPNQASSVEAQENYSNIFVEPQSSPIQTISVEYQSGPDQTKPVETQSSPNQASSVEDQENYRNIFVEPQSSPIQTTSVESQSGPDQTQPVETQSSPNQASSVEPYEEGEANENYSNIFVESQSGPDQTQPVETQSSPNQASSVEPYEDSGQAPLDLTNSKTDYLQVKLYNTSDHTQSEELYTVRTVANPDHLLQNESSLNSNTTLEINSHTISNLKEIGACSPNLSQKVDLTLPPEHVASPEQTLLVEPFASPDHLPLVEPYISPVHPELVEPYTSPQCSVSLEMSISPDHPQLVEPYASPDFPQLVEPYTSPDRQQLDEPYHDTENPQACQPCRSPVLTENAGSHTVKPDLCSNSGQTLASPTVTCPQTNCDIVLLNEPDINTDSSSTNYSKDKKDYFQLHEYSSETLVVPKKQEMVDSDNPQSSKLNTSVSLQEVPCPNLITAYSLESSLSPKETISEEYSFAEKQSEETSIASHLEHSTSPAQLLSKQPCCPHIINQAESFSITDPKPLNLCTSPNGTKLDSSYVNTSEEVLSEHHVADEEKFQSKELCCIDEVLQPPKRFSSEQEKLYSITDQHQENFKSPSMLHTNNQSLNDDHVPIPEYEHPSAEDTNEDFDKNLHVTVLSDTIVNLHSGEPSCAIMPSLDQHEHETITEPFHSEESIASGCDFPDKLLVTEVDKLSDKAPPSPDAVLLHKTQSYCSSPSKELSDSTNTIVPEHSSNTEHSISSEYSVKINQSLDQSVKTDETPSTGVYQSQEISADKFVENTLPTENSSFPLDLTCVNQDKLLCLTSNQATDSSVECIKHKPENNEECMKTNNHFTITPPDLLPYDSDQPTDTCCGPSSEPIPFNSQPPPELLPYDSEQPANSFLSISDYSTEQGSSVFHAPPELLPYDSDQPIDLHNQQPQPTEELLVHDSTTIHHEPYKALDLPLVQSGENFSNSACLDIHEVPEKCEPCNEAVYPQPNFVKEVSSESPLTEHLSPSETLQEHSAPSPVVDCTQEYPGSSWSSTDENHFVQQSVENEKPVVQLDLGSDSTESLISRGEEKTEQTSLTNISDTSEEQCTSKLMNTSKSETSVVLPLVQDDISLETTKQSSPPKSLTLAECPQSQPASMNTDPISELKSRPEHSRSRSRDRKKSRSKSVSKNKRSRSKSVTKTSHSKSLVKSRKSKSRSASTESNRRSPVVKRKESTHGVRKRSSRSASVESRRRSRSVSLSPRKRSKSSSVGRKCHRRHSRSPSEIRRRSRSPSVPSRRRSQSLSRKRRSRSSSVTHKRRSPSPSVTRRRRSISTSRRRRSPSPTASRRRRSPSPPTTRRRRSPSVTRRRRSPSPIVTRRRRSPSPIVTRRRRSPSASATRRRRSPSSTRRKRSRSPSAPRRRRSPSPFTTRRRRSSSPATSRRRRSPSPEFRRKRSPSLSVSHNRHSRSPSVPRKRRSRSKSASRRRTSRSASQRKRSRSISSPRKRRSKSKSASKSPTGKQAKSDHSQSPSQSDLSRKRKTRSRSSSRDKKTVEKRRKRSSSKDSSKDYYSAKQRRKSRTPPRRKKSRSPGRRTSVCKSPVRRRRSRSPIRRKSFSRSPIRRKRSRSRDMSMDSARSPKRLTDLDKAQLLEIAKANAAAMCAKAGVPLPPSLKPIMTPAAGMDENITHRTYGVTIQELTEKCKQIAQSKEDDVIVNKPHDSDEEEEERPFYNHPFKVSEHKPISFSLLNPSLKPAPKTQVTLTKEFPVSSGSQHRKKESDKVYGEWVPVDKNTEESKDDVFTNTGPSQPVDISSAMNERAVAQTRLTGNPFDIEAVYMLSRAQEQIDAWAQSTSIPGQFTGSTGAQVLTPEEISNSGPQAWLKKDQFLKAAPVSGGRGALLMRKMGWREGEGLGRNNEGNVDPILLDFKTDRKGLVADGEKASNKLVLPAMKDLSGKHPISALMELCNKKKLSPPEFELVDDTGPEHRKRFLFRVTVNGVLCQPSQPSLTKKLAKATAATAALQALGALPKENMTSTSNFCSASSTTL
ncbi:protein SON isoform X2 [Phyllobates terribilis]